MLTSNDRARIEKRLTAERQRVIEVLQEFENTRKSSLQEDIGELTMYRLHPADIGTETNEQEKEILLTGVEGRRLEELDEALRRLYADPDTFGLCVDCGMTISMERLEVVPEATRCADCQRLAEG